MKAFAAILILPYLLGAGCFVIRGERRIKPDISHNIIKESTDSRGDLIYYRHLDTPEFNLDVGILNDAPAKWELQFLFNILPWYLYRDKDTPWFLTAVIKLEPKLPAITFEPNLVFLLETNHPPLPPGKIWLEPHFPVTNTVNSLSITNRMIFQLTFVDERRSYINRDRPFQISIEGIRASAETRPLPPIHFRPATAVRPGFQLPY